jgi:glutamate racemase
MTKHDFPIGLFDSGVGGTSIWKEVIQLLPNEDTIYLSDSKNAPYGQKSKDEIIKFSIKNTEFLLNQNAKIIVVACNTATTNAIGYLRANYDVPFIGIEPAIKPAGLITQTKKIGILATQGTLNSELFEQTTGKLDPEIEILEQVGEGLVELIENGQMQSKEMDALLKKYLHPMMNANIDALVLGCTHYPYLIPQIRGIIGSEINIIDSGEAVARQTKNILQQHNRLQSKEKEGIHQFYINKDAKVLAQLLGNLPVKIQEKSF